MSRANAYWVIVSGAQPTAFRARDRETLVPTLVRFLLESHASDEIRGARIEAQRWIAERQVGQFVDGRLFGARRRARHDYCRDCADRCPQAVHEDPLVNRGANYTD